jgi:hypothetical protein
MAQEILVKEALEEKKIEAGRELLKRLAKTDFKVVAALWLWTTERPEWELIVASPWVNKNGPLEAYRKIDDIFFGEPRPISEFDFTNIYAMDTSKPLIKALRNYAKKKKIDFTGKRLKDYWLDDVSVDDAYVYFVK